MLVESPMDNADNIVQRLRNAFLFSDPLQAGNTALNLMERTYQRARLRSDPITVQVEVTNKCNLNCIFCSRHYTRLPLGDIASDMLPEVVELSKRSRELILFGYGEPLLSDAFYHLVRANRSARISFTTNGLLLTEDRMRLIIEQSSSPVYNVTFSIDGANSRTYGAIREKSNYSSVWSNLGVLSDYKARRGLQWPQIWINFVAMRENLDELPDLVGKAAALGVSQINVFHLVVWDASYVEQSLIHYPEPTERIFKEARSRARNVGMRLDLPLPIGNSLAPRAGAVQGFSLPRCYLPWSYTYIRHDGSVHACCFSENLVVGNLCQKSFREIWNDAPYREVRSRINRASFPDCRRCELRFRNVPSPNDYETYIKLAPRMK